MCTDGYMPLPLHPLGVGLKGIEGIHMDTHNALTDELMKGIANTPHLDQPPRADDLRSGR